MIPEKYTPVSNEIMIEIIAKGLLNKNEIRIAHYIMRWSWGWGNKGEKERQDWTRKLYKGNIADDIGMDRGNLNVVLNKMIKEGKVIVEDRCYQFNEHYKDWNIVNLTIKYCKFNNKKLLKLHKNIVNLTMSTTDEGNDGNGLSDRKEKKRKRKEKKEESLLLNYTFNKDGDNGGDPTSYVTFPEDYDDNKEEALAGGCYVTFPEGYDYGKEAAYMEMIKKAKDKEKAIKALINEIDDEECEKLIKMTYKQWDEFQRQYPNGDRKSSELYSQIVDIIVARGMAEAGM